MATAKKKQGIKLKHFLEANHLSMTDICNQVGRSRHWLYVLFRQDIIQDHNVLLLEKKLGLDIRAAITANIPTVPVTVTTGDAGYVELLKKKDEHIDRLLAIIETMSKTSKK